MAYRLRRKPRGSPVAHGVKLRDRVIPFRVLSLVVLAWSLVRLTIILAMP